MKNPFIVALKRPVRRPHKSCPENTLCPNLSLRTTFSILRIRLRQLWRSG